MLLTMWSLLLCPTPSDPCHILKNAVQDSISAPFHDYHKWENPFLPSNARQTIIYVPRWWSLYKASSCLRALVIGTVQSLICAACACRITGSVTTSVTLLNNGIIALPRGPRM